MTLRIEPYRDSDDGRCRVVIDEDLTIYTISALKQEISPALDTYRHIEIDLAGIEEVDSAGIQLLLAFRMDVMRQEKSLTLISLSTSLINMLERYGLSQQFNTGDV
ncbi:MAG: anti-sigma B factor antagonist [Oleiphilaceae bacterium]|jgi:anti-anti-sigma factor